MEIIKFWAQEPMVVEKFNISILQTSSQPTLSSKYFEQEKGFNIAYHNSILCAIWIVPIDIRSLMCYI